MHRPDRVGTRGVLAHLGSTERGLDCEVRRRCLLHAVPPAFGRAPWKWVAGVGRAEPVRFPRAEPVRLPRVPRAEPARLPMAEPVRFPMA